MRPRDHQEPVERLYRIVERECARCRRQRFQYHAALGVALVMLVIGLLLPSPLRGLPAPVALVLSFGTLVAVLGALLIAR